MVIQNMLIEWANDEGPCIDRVLWVAPDGEIAVVIRLEDNTALPRKMMAAEFQSGFDSNRCRILSDDPYCSLHKPDENYPENHLGRRDKAWNQIAPIIELPPEKRFDPVWRGKTIRELVEQGGHHKKAIYKYLRRYWQGGQIKNALLPRFELCGGRGKPRNYSSKPGRKNYTFIEAGLGSGIVVGLRETQNLQKGYRLFYENFNGHSMQTAYRKTLDRFFHTGYRLERGILVPVLPPPDQLPTFFQFRYCNLKNRSTKRLIVRREGQRKFDLENRPHLGDATQVTHGPGSLYQLDSSVVELNVVNSLDRTRVLVRPTVYFVIDVFSRLIAGFAVCFGEPNCTGALLALENASCDKQQFCRCHGVDILPEEWPSAHLPESLLADRRELKDPKADALAHALGISLLLTPPFRPDLNGTVEGSFSRLKGKLIQTLPGSFQKEENFPVKCSKAVLDVHQFTQVLIHYILAYNRTSLERYRQTAAMIRDQVDSRPIDLWEWGIRNCSGHLRSCDQSSLRRNLLPKAEASITEKGLHFGRCHYVNENAINDEWFLNARRNGSSKVEILFDPRKLANVYLFDAVPELTTWHLCEGDKHFAPCNEAEVNDIFTFKRTKQTLDRLDEVSINSKCEVQIERIIADAYRLRPRPMRKRRLAGKRVGRVVPAHGTLMALVKEGRSTNQTAYDSLKARGLIKGVEDLLP